VKTFRIEADAEFLADDIDEAFLLLAMHFQMLALGRLDGDLLTGGEITIRPAEPEEAE
jgi:hypothetical protein